MYSTWPRSARSGAGSTTSDEFGDTTDTALDVTPLGGTGMAITRVGLGAWAMGGAGWPYSLGAQDDRDSIATIHAAVKVGVNWIDTAAVYGLGHSEEVIGRALRGLPAAERPYVFTKGGLVWDPSDHSVEPAKIASPKSLRTEVEDSLRRLQTERIDLYQVHWPPMDGTALQDYWQAMLDLKAEGKVRAVGLSNHDVAQLEAAEALGHVDSLQPVFNAIHREAAADVVPWCDEHGTGVIVYSPLASGLLTGAYTVERATTPDPRDRWRSVHPDFQAGAVERNLAVADVLRPIAQRRNISVAAVAVAWTLAFPISGAIVGARRPAQLDGWIAAGTTTLDHTELDEIGEGIARAGAGAGPVRP
jgi:aryl-alcohol dehydrogenase-like predicted oxidoreductase